MLKGLDIKNVAVIEKLNIEFPEGLSVLTGETGAGKSIIIDSIDMILGARSNKTLVRHGADKAMVSALFSVDKKLEKILEDYGVEAEDGDIIINRDLTPEGKSNARINGMMVPMGVLKEISEKLVNIHGQQDSHSILDREKHIEYLDLFGENGEILKRYKEKFEEVKEIRKKLNEIIIDEDEKLRRIDLLNYQVSEIEKAELRVGEKKELEEDRIRVRNLTAIAEGVYGAYSALYENDTMSAYDGVCHAENALSRVAEFDKELEKIASRITDIKYAIEDVVHELKGMDVEFDEQQLNDIEERLDTITTLEKKYGGDTEKVLEYFEKISEELQNIKNSDEIIKKLESDLEKEERTLREIGKELSEKRGKDAEVLSGLIKKELSELDMPKAEFHVVLEWCEEFLKNGMDRVEFMITTNPGEPIKPLTKVASGGELSRTMLAIKTVLSEVSDSETLIFDEIDTGVSGRAAQKIAVKLWGLGRKNQVISISHQSQLAAYADNHFYIEKCQEGERTVTKVKKLSDTERIEELARIIDGENISDTARTHASQMIDTAKAVCRELIS